MRRDMTATMEVNGRACPVAPLSPTLGAAPTLLDVLREQVGDMSVKPGCRVGRCGGCMVLLDGQAINACLLPAYRAAGRSVITAAGIEMLPEGAIVREELVQGNAFQCGYCAPGFVIAITALMRETGGHVGRAQIRAAMSGNLCRCTGYASIERAVLRIARRVAAIPAGD